MRTGTPSWAAALLPQLRWPGRVAGYDFLRDGAEQVRQELDARVGVNSPAEPTLIGDAWTRQNLIDALLPATPPGLASLNGHADHFRLMPPSPANATTRPQPFTTTDLTAKDARRVKGGGGEVVARKAGKEQHDYLIVKMTDVLITGVAPSGNIDPP